MSEHCYPPVLLLACSYGYDSFKCLEDIDTDAVYPVVQQSKLYSIYLCIQLITCYTLQSCLNHTILRATNLSGVQFEETPGTLSQSAPTKFNSRRLRQEWALVARGLARPQKYHLRSRRAAVASKEAANTYPHLLCPCIGPGCFLVPAFVPALLSCTPPLPLMVSLLLRYSLGVRPLPFRVENGNAGSSFGLYITGIYIDDIS